MIKKIILSATFFTLPWLSFADELQINEGAPNTYIVEEGDTLWDISSIFLEQPWLWPQLWRLNPEISNPHLIYPGDVLRLVYDDEGEPQLVVEEEPEYIEEIIEEPVVVEEVIEEPVIVEAPPREKPTLKLSPKVRKQVKKTPITTLPLHVIAPYVKYDHLLTQAQVDTLPNVIGSDQGHKSSLDGFKVYVNDDLVLGKSYAIYYIDDEIIDPETEKSLGFNVKLTGTAQAIRSGDMAKRRPGTLLVNSANREIRSGNIVMPINEGQLLPSFFTMQKADESVRGLIVKASSDNREFGKLEVIMINRGEMHSVKVGDILTIQRKSPAVVETKDGPQYKASSSRWERMSADPESEYDMPEEPLGQVMVFKVYENAAMALIMKTNKPARLLDSVAAPQ
ncbi:LysM peptidoglycan-binding domain-containing protein [Thalassotalea sp. M1531]|uniref:LysM peptidoglycan-binding domain-containing protein n=1 Tax=Thalassotalea algicola TaxID=2716224 RepID=A0A7Y0LA78_9GAMM|nr:LysM domain-containing protein [Thalassotalea algicola]NMP30823.1 LysM peptidoglycan-binding domain-containing protein [Thalassotalea algicola]